MFTLLLIFQCISEISHNRGYRIFSKEGSVELMPMNRFACAFAAGINEKKDRNVLKGSCRHLKSNLAMQVFPAHDCMLGHSCLSGLFIYHYPQWLSKFDYYNKTLVHAYSTFNLMCSIIITCMCFIPGLCLQVALLK